MVFVIRGVTYHRRICIRCGGLFFTTAKYSHPPVCAECANSTLSKSIDPERWKKIIQERKAPLKKI